MRLIFLIFFSFLWLQYSIFANSIDHNFSDIAIAEIETNEGWPRFLVETGIQQIDICFPVTPTVEDYGDIVALSAVDTSVFPSAIYGISFHKQPEEIRDPLYLFEEILAQKSTEPNILLWKNMSVDGDQYILDTITKSVQYRVFRKDRVIVTAQSIYYLYTVFFIGSFENHEYFIDSFNNFPY